MWKRRIDDFTPMRHRALARETIHAKRPKRIGVNRICAFVLFRAARPLSDGRNLSPIREGLALAKAPAWTALAAYLYVLRLDGPALGWEYLRRNRRYRSDWQSNRDDPAFAGRWGLAMSRDPSLDACTTQPMWRGLSQGLVRIAASDAADDEDVERFSLWSIAGRKCLAHLGSHLMLTAVRPERVLRLGLASDVCEGEPFDYRIQAGLQLRSQWRAIAALHDVLKAAEAPRRYVVASHPHRLALLHMRALEAQDGLAAGASQREIAEVLFGVARVAGDWHADSELRAQVRHLIRRGESLVDGGYRRLVTLGAGYAPGD